MVCCLDNKESEFWGVLLSGEWLDIWICFFLGFFMVGFSGVFLLFVIFLEMGIMLCLEVGVWCLKQLFSFVLGGFLGNVFLYLLFEVWVYMCSVGFGGEGQSLQQQQQLGLWVIVGILIFLVLEKMFLDSKVEGISQVFNKDFIVVVVVFNGGYCLVQLVVEFGFGVVVWSIKVSGYFNLLVNIIDNFIYGLVVVVSFFVSKKIGFLIIMVIFLYEIFYEVGDFVILFWVGFD